MRQLYWQSDCTEFGAVFCSKRNNSGLPRHAPVRAGAPIARNWGAGSSHFGVHTFHLSTLRVHPRPLESSEGTLERAKTLTTRHTSLVVNVGRRPGEPKWVPGGPNRHDVDPLFLVPPWCFHDFHLRRPLSRKNTQLFLVVHCNHWRARNFNIDSEICSINKHPGYTVLVCKYGHVTPESNPQS